MDNAYLRRARATHAVDLIDTALESLDRMGDYMTCGACRRRCPEDRLNPGWTVPHTCCGQTGATHPEAPKEEP